MKNEKEPENVKITVDIPLPQDLTDDEILKLQFVQNIIRLNKAMPWNLLEKISGSEYMLILTVKNHCVLHPDQPGIYVSELAKQLDVTVPAVSNILRKLERQSLIRREVDENNRRNTYVIITESGEEVFYKNKNLLFDFRTKLFDKIGRDKITRITSDLSELIAGMNSVRRELQSKQNEQANFEE